MYETAPAFAGRRPFGGVRRPRYGNFWYILRHPNPAPGGTLRGAGGARRRRPPPSGGGPGAGGRRRPVPAGAGRPPPLGPRGGHPVCPGGGVGQLVRPSGTAPDGGGGHRHQRQDHHHLPAQSGAGGGGGPGGSHRYQPGAHRGAEPARPAHHPRELGAPAPLLPDGLRRMHPCGHGGLLPRPGPPPHRRHPLCGGGVHQPDRGPSGLSRHHGGLPGGQGAAVQPVRRGGAQPGRRGGALVCVPGEVPQGHLLRAPGRGRPHRPQPAPVSRPHPVRGRHLGKAVPGEPPHPRGVHPL